MTSPNAIIADMQAEIDALRKERDKLLDYVESEYAELADFRNDWTGRNAPEGQWKLCRLRDLISETTGRDQEDVQNDFGTRRAIASVKGGA